jgi:hypothetical protein
MNQKSSLREDPQFVSWVLTGDNYDTSWHQLWTGRDISVQAEIEGKTLTFTSDPFKASIDGKEIVVVTTWERVE